MDVTYAAEKRSIAELLEHHVKENVRPEDINVTENPSETGSFYIGWRLRHRVQAAAPLAGADRLNDSRRRFPFAYSARSAVIGSMRAARRPGP
jgi:hypothetical protein